MTTAFVPHALRQSMAEGIAEKVDLWRICPPLAPAPAAPIKYRLRDLRFSHFDTDFGCGPKRLFVFNHKRPFERIQLRHALLHPIKAWRFFHGWRES